VIKASQRISRLKRRVGPRESNPPLSVADTNHLSASGCIGRREFAQNLQRTLRENLARILGKRAAKPSDTLRCHSVSGPRRLSGAASAAPKLVIERTYLTVRILAVETVWSRRGCCQEAISAIRRFESLGQVSLEMSFMRPLSAQCYGQPSQGSSRVRPGWQPATELRSHRRNTTCSCRRSSERKPLACDM